jgi:hypothetical protein
MQAHSLTTTTCSTNASVNAGSTQSAREDSATTAPFQSPRENSATKAPSSAREVSSSMGSVSSSQEASSDTDCTPSPRGDSVPAPGPQEISSDMASVVTVQMPESTVQMPESTVQMPESTVLMPVECAGDTGGEVDIVETADGFHCDPRLLQLVIQSVVQVLRDTTPSTPAQARIRQKRGSKAAAEIADNNKRVRKALEDAACQMTQGPSYAAAMTASQAITANPVTAETSSESVESFWAPELQTSDLAEMNSLLNIE